MYRGNGDHDDVCDTGGNAGTIVATRILCVYVGCVAEVPVPFLAGPDLSNGLNPHDIREVYVRALLAGVPDIDRVETLVMAGVTDRTARRSSSR